MAEICQKDLDRTESVLTEKIKTVQAILTGDIKNLQTLVKENDKRYAQTSAGQDKAVDKAFVSAQAAIDKSEANQTKINDGTYVKLSDLTTLLSGKISTSDYQANHKTTTDSLNKLELAQKDLVPLTAYNLNNDNLQKQITAISTNQTSQTGAVGGVKGSWTILIQAVGLISTLIIIYLAISGHIK